MKKLILAIIAMVGITGAETLTGKVILAGSKTNAVSAQVCMNGVCGDVASDGSYSLTVGSSSIARSHGSTYSADFYRQGNLVMSASGKKVELLNTQGRTVAYGNGSLNLDNIPAGVYFATDGKHVLRLNTMTKSGYAASGSGGTVAGVAARAADTVTSYGTAYIVVNGDTLKEIPVTSWNLPIGYMVQRNATVITGDAYKGDSTQVVYWDNDSIAYVVKLGVDQLSDTVQYTGGVYAYYDSAAFKNDDKIFSYFARTCKNDTIFAYSNVGTATAKLLDFSVGKGRFHLTAYHGAGYSLVPALDTVSKWADSAALNYDRSWISFDSLTTKMMNRDTSISYTAGLPSANSVLASADSVRMSFNVVDTGYARLYIQSTTVNTTGRFVAVTVKNAHIEAPSYGYVTGDTSYAYAVGGLRGLPAPILTVMHIFQCNADGDDMPVTAIKNLRIYIHVKN